MATGLRRSPAYVAVLAMFTTLVVACGGGGDGGTTPPSGGTGTIGIALSSSSASAQAGTSASTTVSLSRSGTFTGTINVTVEGAPSGVTATLASTSVAAGVTSTVLNMVVASSATAGSYPLTVRATGTGVAAVAATYTLTVTAAPVPDFAIAVTPTALTVVEGTSGTAQIAITRTGGFASTVFLTPSGTLPTDVSVSFSPNDIATASTMTVTVGLGVAPGVYPLSVTGAAQGVSNRTTPFTLTVTPKPSAGTLTLSPTTMQVVQGQSSAGATVTLTRGTGITGAAQFTLENAPIGVTGTFTPNPVSGNSTVLVLSAITNAPVGAQNIRIRATIGEASVTLSFLLGIQAFVPPDFGITLNPSALAVIAGGVTSSTATFTRTGSFADGITLVVNGAPAGVTATATPSPTIGNTATINISTTGAVVPGVYPLVVSGTSPLTTGARTANLNLTVNSPAGAGNVQWQFCNAERVPLWMGTRTGSSGAWTRITAGANNTFAIPFSQTGQIAYVHSSTDGFNVTVLGFTPAEAFAAAATECESNPATKSISGSVTNLLPSRVVTVIIGGAKTATMPGVNSYSLTSVKDGVTDILGYMGYFENGLITGYDRLIIRRNINPAPGSVMSVMDFEGSEYAFAAGSNGFFANFGADPFTTSMAYVTSNGAIGTYQFDLPSTTSPRTLWGVPQSLRAANDLHRMTAVTANATAPRTIVKYTSGPASGTNTFGPLLNAPNLSVLGTSPVRLRAQGTWQAEYNASAGVSFIQSGAAPNARTVTVTGSNAFFGAAAGYDFDVPDFTGAPGWDPNWMLKPGVVTSANVNAIGLSAGASFTPADGVTQITGARVGSITP